jgi:hypothetical protein
MSNVGTLPGVSISILRREEVISCKRRENVYRGLIPPHREGNYFNGTFEGEPESLLLSTLIPISLPWKAPRGKVPPP